MSNLSTTTAVPVETSTHTTSRDGSVSSAVPVYANPVSQSGPAEGLSGAEMSNPGATTAAPAETGANASTLDGSASSAANLTSQFAPAAEESFADMSNAYESVTSEVNSLISHFLICTHRNLDVSPLPKPTHLQPHPHLQPNLRMLGT